jgi:hypothetical protein
LFQLRRHLRAVFPEAFDVLLELANGKKAAVSSDVALVIDNRPREAVLRRGSDRQHILRIVKRLQRRSSRQIPPVVGIAEDELARFDEWIGSAPRRAL